VDAGHDEPVATDCQPGGDTGPGAERLREARFAPVTDEPLTNAAVELLRSVSAYLNAVDGPPTRTTVTSDDVTFDDRRSGGVNFGKVESSDWLPFIASIWEVGTGRPHFSIPEIVAVRGWRCAAAVWAYDYGDDWADAEIICIRLTPERMIDRCVAFDVDDVDAAVAQLDRWHAEFDV